MTFAELAIFLIVGFAFYAALKPLRLRLEEFFYRLFRGRRKGPGPIIDITDYKKQTDQE